MGSDAANGVYYVQIGPRGLVCVVQAAALVQLVGGPIVCR